MEMLALKKRTSPCHKCHEGIDQGIPETRSAYRKTDEAWHSGGHSQPDVHLFVALSPPENDAADIVASAASGCGHDVLAVLPFVEPLDLSDARFDFRVLKLLNGLDHQSRTCLQVMSLLVPIDLT